MLNHFLLVLALLAPELARYGSVAAEMERSGDWLVPRLNGVEHLEKPPLATWAMAALQSDATDAGRRRRDRDDFTDPLRLAAWFYPASHELVNAAGIIQT